MCVSALSVCTCVHHMCACRREKRRGRLQTTLSEFWEPNLGHLCEQQVGGGGGDGVRTDLWSVCSTGLLPSSFTLGVLRTLSSPCVAFLTAEAWKPVQCAHRLIYRLRVVRLRPNSESSRGCTELDFCLQRKLSHQSELDRKTGAMRLGIDMFCWMNLRIQSIFLSLLPGREKHSLEGKPCVGADTKHILEGSC